MGTKRFTKDFTQQEPIPEESISRAVEVLHTGRLHRYNVAPGETSEASLLEQEFAAYLGTKYCLACASCGSSIYLALKSAGVHPGDVVLCNAFTLAPVSGMIENSGARIELVEIEPDYTIDLQDLEAKAGRSGAKWLLLSHMRGHIADMDKLMSICRDHKITVIEDCAHTMGARWSGRKSGTFGLVSCFSTQTYKHLNSGEGGFLATNDPDLIARAIFYSGSYMLYESHLSRPEREVFERYKLLIPNYSCRMDNLRAALLRPQLARLDQQCQRWNERYRHLEKLLNEIPGVRCPRRDPREDYVGSSIQFDLAGLDTAGIRRFLAACGQQGVAIKWFGDSNPVGFTSVYQSWQYWGPLPRLEKTNRILATLCDMRIPLTFELEDCSAIAEIIADVLRDIRR